MKTNILLIIMALFSVQTLHAKKVKKVQIPDSPRIYCIIQDGNYIYCGKNGVGKTDDWGQSFEKLSTLHTNDGGIVDMEEEDYIVMKLFKSAEGVLLASVRDNYIIYSHNDGADWYETNIKSEGKQNFYEYGDSLFLLNDGQLYYSHDDGVNWVVMLARQYVDPDKTRECYILQDTLYLLRKEHQNKTDCIMTIIDLKNDNSYPVETESDLDYLYSYQNNLYAYNYLGLYQKIANNKWSLSVNFKQKIQALYDNTSKTINPLTFMADQDVLVFGFWTEASVPSPHMEYAISWDNGENWTLVNWNGNQSFNNDMKVIDGSIYITVGDIYKYDLTENKFMALGAKSTRIYTPKKYREMNHYNVYQDAQDNWYTDSTGSWQLVENSRSLHYSLSGDLFYYNSDENTLYTYNSSGIETVTKDMIGFHVIQESGIFQVIEYVQSAQRYVSICKDSKIIWSKNGLDYPYDRFFVDNQGDYIYSTKDANNNYILNIGNVDEITTESFELGAFIKPNRMSSLSRSGNKIAFRSSWGQIYTSDNLTQKIDSTLDSDVIDPYSSVQVINDKFYAGTSIGLLVSDDGLAWTQLIDDQGEYSVNSFEYSPDNQLYIYTNKGVFITEVPVSVEEIETKSPEISIYPNPSADYISIDLDTEFKVVKIWDMHGRSYNITADGNQIDVSKLPISQYILEIETEGKSYYKFFKVVR